MRTFGKCVPKHKLFVLLVVQTRGTARRSAIARVVRKVERGEHVAFAPSMANSGRGAVFMCMQHTGPGTARRKCLVVRARAAAAGGHPGAQLGVLGSTAIGAKITVYWPMDKAWYPGMVGWGGSYRGTPG